MGAPSATRRTLIRLPERRPPGLRLRAIPGPFYRIEAHSFSQWGWERRPAPRFRFDPASGAVRVRYAATSSHGAARERYRDAGSYIPPDHAAHYLITLTPTAPTRVLDLRQEAVLDALGLDDRISTGHDPGVWAAAQGLTDLVLAWWGGAVHGIAYRSRTTPQTSANMAFFRHAPLAGRSQQLRRARPFLDSLVVRHGFAVDL